jgi:protein TonB
VGGVLGNTLPAKAETRKAGPVTARAQRRVQEIRNARLIQRVEPVYPLAARHARVEGRVMLMLVVDILGRVVEARVLAGPAQLALAAQAAVLQWRFEPGRNADGREVISQILQPVDFRLR